MQTTNDENDNHKTLCDAMAEIENGQKWWTLKELTSLLKYLGWISSGQDKICKADVHALIPRALPNARVECRFNQATQEDEFRLYRKAEATA